MPLTSQLVLPCLPADVLLQMLSYLLIDTPRSATRAAVVRTCKTLHELGTPLLHRYVDLRGIQSEEQLVGAWKRLFGWRGTLTEGGRFDGLARNVVELRVGGPINPLPFSTLPEVVFHPAQLSRCRTLVIDEAGLFMSPFDLPFVWNFLASLPIVVCTIQESRADTLPSMTRSFSKAMAAQLFGSSRQPWKDLETIRTQGTVFWDAYDKARREITPRLALSEWSFKLLALELPDRPSTPAPGPVQSDEGTFYSLFFDPVRPDESTSWWRGLERIELTVPSSMEAEMRRRLEEKRWAASIGLQRRILPMVVFVDKDGSQRKLIGPTPGL